MYSYCSIMSSPCIIYI